MKKIIKKVIAIILVTALMLPVYSLSGITQAASVNYDRTAALNYAAAHWNDGKGKCAEFVSDCLKAGGVPAYDTIVYYLWSELQGMGTAYKLTTSGSSIYASDNAGKVQPGDPLFYVCKTCGGLSGARDSFAHVVICSRTDSNGKLNAYGHNGAWNNQEWLAGYKNDGHSGHTFEVYSFHIQSTFTLSYNANGGSGTPAKQTVAAGTSATISSTKPTRTGYTFLGWSKSSSATSASYSAGSKITLNADTTLYAVWAQQDLGISIAKPSKTTVKSGETLLLQTVITGIRPSGSTIRWTSFGDHDFPGSFSIKTSDGGTKATLSPKTAGKAMVTVELLDKNGKILVHDYIMLTAKIEYK